MRASRPPVAPLLVVDARIVAAAHDRAVGFERDQRGGGGLRRDAEGRGEPRLGHGPQAFEPATENLDQRRVRRQSRRASPGGGAISGLSAASEKSPGTGSTARRESISRRQRRQGARPASRRPVFEPTQPFRIGGGLRLGEAADPEQSVVQLFRIGRVRHASERTRAIASGSSRPSSDGLCGSRHRRAITACVRRSSSGASSR